MSFPKGEDPRYDLISLLIEKSRIEDFSDFFRYVPKTVVSNDLGMKLDRFNLGLEDPGIFTISKLKAMASLFRIDPLVLAKFMLKQPEKTPQSQDSE